MNTFPKKEHLYGEKTINELHSEGIVFMSYPFRVVYLLAGESECVPVRVMVSVAKKRFKLAVNRNRIKRLIREVYRLNKSGIIDFVETNNYKIHVSFQYISNEEETFEYLNDKMSLTLNKLKENIEKNIKNIDENAEKNT